MKKKIFVFQELKSSLPVSARFPKSFKLSCILSCHRVYLQDATEKFDSAVLNSQCEITCDQAFFFWKNAKV